MAWLTSYDGTAVVQRPRSAKPLFYLYVRL